MARGAFGVPTFFVDGEMFFGKDRLRDVEEAILAAESKVETLQAKLSAPGVYKDHAAEVPLWVAALDAARAEVDRLYARWQELESLVKK